MKFVVMHPSKGRPEPGLLCAKDNLCKTSGKHFIKYIMGIDETDPKKNLYSLNSRSITKLHSGFELNIFHSKNYVECVNQMGHLFDGDIGMIASDDFVLPINWDLLLENAILKSKFKISDEFVVAVYDGKQPRMITFPIFSKNWYLRFNYIYYPEYESMYCDEDLTNVAYTLNKVIEAKHILFEHKHWSFNKRTKDKVDEIQSSNERYITGKLVFEKRKSRNFDL